MPAANGVFAKRNTDEMLVARVVVFYLMRCYILFFFYLKPFSDCSKPFLLTTFEALPFSSLLSYAFSLASSVFFC